ncbi:MAG: 23S rRNA (guanosine(2251)-2'-O)-methyltransferase RlmB [Candidatus Nanopelagicales bacterium]
MAGNSKRKGAVRGSGGKKGMTVGSGGQRRRGLEGKGPTPRADRRPGHPAARKSSRRSRDTGTRREVILGRNAVDEALAAGVPAVELAVGDFLTDDVRTLRAKAAASAAGVPVVIRSKPELDQLGDGLPHQGIALVVAPFAYAELHDVIQRPGIPGRHPIIVVLDHLQDSRNLGAISRSAAAFGASGLVVPDRRSAHVTAAAWRSSAGALARLPVARVVNMTRALGSLQKAGFVVAGLATTGGTSIADVPADVWDQPVVIVVGNEANGISALVAQTCDLLVTIPVADTTESLNASVATAIALDRIRNR